MIEEKEFKVTPIEYGTVVDHLPSGSVLRILKILDPPNDKTVSFVINVKSKKYGWKDVIKLEDFYPDDMQLSKISLIAPDATINRIEKYEVKDKYKVPIPKEYEGVIRCQNLNCITNTDEKRMIKPKILRKDNGTLYCDFCDRIQDIEKIYDYLT